MAAWPTDGTLPAKTFANATQMYFPAHGISEFPLQHQNFRQRNYKKNVVG